MTYVSPNYKTKKALKEAVATAKKNGALPIDVFEPGLGTVPRDGKVYLEGPHYPKPHTWYAVGVMKDGMLISVS